MVTVFLGLGSNLGDRKNNLERALAALKASGVEITRTSRIYETEPVGFTDQEWFLNMVAEGETELQPEALVKLLQDAEKQLGRTETFKWGPRMIDIDLLFYDMETLETENLTIPHKHLHERRFVLEPLSELASDLIHPGLGKTIRQLLKECPDTAIVRPL